MKEQYGIGGQSHALSRADNSYADYNGKGLQLSRGNPGAYHTKEELSWQKVAKRVDYLIKNDHFLQAGDYAHMPEYEPVSYTHLIPLPFLRPEMHNWSMIRKMMIQSSSLTSRQKREILFIW